MNGIDEALALAGRLADAAAAETRPRFRRAVPSERKGDLTPVTEADMAAERAIRAMLSVERPDDAIAGEEYGHAAGRSGLTWVIDPIDGTEAFMTGRPSFVTLIALLEGGKPILGVIDQPIVGDRWVGAAGRQTLLNGMPVHTHACDGLEVASFSTTGPHWFPPEEAPVYRALSTGARSQTYGGDGYAYGLLAGGWLDIVLECRLKLHDFAAVVPVIEGAGGAITDWSGRPLDAGSDGHVLAVGDRRLHGQILERIRRLGNDSEYSAP